MKKKLIFIAAATISIFFSSCSIPNINSKPKSSSAATTPYKKIADCINKVTNKPDNYPLSSMSIDESKLSNTKRAWYYTPHTDGTPSSEPQDVLNLIQKYSAYYLGDTSKKILYLTFDEGYENGYSSKILDILKANNVKAAFFVTKPYVDSEKGLVKRMVSEGHLVCNHTVHHPSMPSVLDKTKFEKELLDLQKDFEDLTGTSMPRFFRPPMGEYSELSLYRTQNIGYKTIFWSFAYNDWDPKKQPDTENAKKRILSRTHNGGIILLHAVSKTNTDILDYLIKQWKSEGYEFKTLNDLP